VHISINSYETTRAHVRIVYTVHDVIRQICLQYKLHCQNNWN